MQLLNIGGRNIGAAYPPYIIAELSANHNGSLENALTLIKKAKEAGADAIKIQTYRADTITIQSDKDEFTIKEGLWQGQTLFDLYESAHTPWEWHQQLFDYARSLDITLFSSPFDKTAVDLLENLNTPAYKIASFEAIDLPLIRYVASTKKPMIISTGMANAEEIAEAVDAAKSHGCKQLALLHCVSAYPAQAEDYNLRTIVDIADRFNTVTGLSDHTLGNTTALSSIALGAAIVEKHFTLDRNGGGPDDSFSMEPQDLQALCRDAQVAWQALGQVSYHRTAAEEENRQFRRSLYIVEAVEAGEVLTEDNVRSIRPGFGLPPKALDKVLGKRFKQALVKGTALQMEHLEQI